MIPFVKCFIFITFFRGVTLRENGKIIIVISIEKEEDEAALTPTIS